MAGWVEAVGQPLFVLDLVRTERAKLCIISVSSLTPLSSGLATKLALGAATGGLKVEPGRGAKEFGQIANLAIPLIWSNHAA